MLGRSRCYAPILRSFSTSCIQPDGHSARPAQLNAANDIEQHKAPSNTNDFQCGTLFCDAARTAYACG